MNRVDLTRGLEQAWADFLTFMPKVVLALVILVAGYIIAKLLCRLLAKLLERIGFNRLVERGGIERALARTQFNASELLARLVFYGVMLLVLQVAFGVFGANPVSAMLTEFVAFIPKLFAALVIVIVAAAIAAAVKDILQPALAGLSFGRLLANVASAFIIATGIFAALSQIDIAPAIVNGLYYALLAIIAGSAIVAIGGGGILPMRGLWENALDRMKRESAQPGARSPTLAEGTAPRAAVRQGNAEVAAPARS